MLFAVRRTAARAACFVLEPVSLVLNDFSNWVWYHADWPMSRDEDGR